MVARGVETLHLAMSSRKRSRWMHSGSSGGRSAPSVYIVAFSWCMGAWVRGEQAVNSRAVKPTHQEYAIDQVEHLWGSGKELVAGLHQYSAPINTRGPDYGFHACHRYRVGTNQQHTVKPEHHRRTITQTEQSTRTRGQGLP